MRDARNKCVVLISQTHFPRSGDVIYPQLLGIWVWGRDYSSVAFIERIALWDGPAMMILLAASTAMLIMMITLARKVCCRLNSYEPITNGDQFAKALKHLLPLAAFPLLFFIFFIPVLMFHIYVAANSKTSEGVLISAVVFYSLWSMASGLTLVIHVTVVKCLGTKKHSTLIKNRQTAGKMWTSP